MLCNYLSELGERTGATGAEVYAYLKMDRQPDAHQTNRNFEEAVHEAYRIMFAAEKQTGQKATRRGRLGQMKSTLKLLKPHATKS